jgi:UDP-sugar pyrophosphorylase
MIDINAKFSLIPNKLEIETKPHGHGDVHTLVYSSGLSKKWLEEK